MIIEIYNENEIMNLEDYLYQNQVESFLKERKKLESVSIDFSSINKLKGDKYILGEAFKQTKFEEINNWIYGE